MWRTLRLLFLLLVSAPSLLACLCTFNLWQQSYEATHYWWWNGEYLAPGDAGITSTRGEWIVWWNQRTAWGPKNMAQLDVAPARNYANYQGFAIDRNYDGGNICLVNFPHTLPIGIFALIGAPAAWIISLAALRMGVFTGRSPVVRAAIRSIRKANQDRRVRMIMHQRQYNRQFCAGCGYDLRATPTRCPECGRRNLISSRPEWTLEDC